MFGRFLKKSEPRDNRKSTPPVGSETNRASLVERRRSRRRNIALEIHLASDRYQRGEPFSGLTVDVSECGLKFETTEVSQKGSIALLGGNRRVAVGITHPDYPESLHLYATVVWMDYRSATKESGAICYIGLDFDQVPESTRVALEKILAD